MTDSYIGNSVLKELRELNKFIQSNPLRTEK